MKDLEAGQKEMRRRLAVLPSKEARKRAYVVRLYGRGVSPQRIAFFLNSRTSTVLKILHTAGVVVPD
jgi:hypothetical protein